jgi:hypothetical protein
MKNILVVYEFAEELQCSAILLSTVAPHHFAELLVEPVGECFLSTVAPHHFAELLVEPVGECFLWFGSTNKPKGLFVEPTVNALRSHKGLQISNKVTKITAIKVKQRSRQHLHVNNFFFFFSRHPSSLLSQFSRLPPLFCLLSIFLSFSLSSSPFSFRLADTHTIHFFFFCHIFFFFFSPIAAEWVSSPIFFFFFSFQCSPSPLHFYEVGERGKSTYIYRY